jgi:hypothetical protein
MIRLAAQAGATRHRLREVANPGFQGCCELVPPGSDEINFRDWRNIPEATQLDDLLCEISQNAYAVDGLA